MYKNTLFSLLQIRHADFLARAATPIVFGAGAVVRGPQAQSSDVIFPETGLIAIVTPLGIGEVIEVGMVGPSGASTSNSLVSVNAVDDAEIAVSDVAGWSIKAADVSTILEIDPTAMLALSRNAEFLLRQSRQLAACHAWHPLEQRLATWFLRATELGQTKALHITQKQLANFLGASSASVSTSAVKFLRMGAVDYMKGRLEILDTAKLEACACSCQRTLHDNHRTLIRSHQFACQAD